MPAFDDETTADAPPEEVWKLLYDPSRFPDWWSGIATVEAGDAKGGDGDVTIYPDGWPDFPMPQSIRTDTLDRNLRVSCMVSDLVFDWRLTPLDAGGTGIAVHVEIPDAEAHRLQAQRAVIADSLRRLAALAATGAPPAPC